MIKERQRILPGYTVKVKTGCGSLFVTINFNGRPTEVFARLGKAGSCFASQLEALCRVISAALRSGVDYEDLIKKLEGIRCPSPTVYDGVEYLSCADALAKAIKIAVEQFKQEGKKL